MAKQGESPDKLVERFWKDVNDIKIAMLVTETDDKHFAVVQCTLSSWRTEGLSGSPVA